MKKSDIAIDNLLDEGWSYDHSALTNVYKASGTVSKMRTRKGFEYCRVHEGKSVGAFNYQITHVMRRPVNN